MDLDFRFERVDVSAIPAEHKELFDVATSAARKISDGFKRAAQGENNGRPPRPELTSAEEHIANQAVKIMDRELNAVNGLGIKGADEVAELGGRTALKIFFGEMASFYVDNIDLAHRRLPVSSPITLNDTMGRLEHLKTNLPDTFPEVDDFIDRAYRSADDEARKQMKHLTHGKPAGVEGPING